MRSTARAWRAMPLMALVTLCSAPALAADPCSGFTWDVRRELGLFAGRATDLAAGGDSAAAPTLAMEHLYSLKLRPLNEVTFVAAPGKIAFPLIAAMRKTVAQGERGDQLRTRNRKLY